MLCHSQWMSFGENPPLIEECIEQGVHNYNYGITWFSVSEFDLLVFYCVLHFSSVIMHLISILRDEYCTNDCMQSMQS